MDLISMYDSFPFREVKNGNGKCLSPSRDKFYIGRIVNGVCHGNGMYYCSDGSAFFGQMLLGKPLKGFYCYKNGDHFEGEWEDGKLRYGKYRYKNGDVFEGSFSNGVRYKGEMRFHSGNVYTGSFDSNGKYSGYGVFNWKTGERYDGTWLDGKRQGTGTIYYKNGTSKTCYWDKDRPVSDL